jgi:LacI family transcriptional regulator
LGDYPESALAETLIAEEFPTVFISHCPKGERVYAVDCDNVQGGYLATQHLIEKGRTQIAFLSSHATSWAEERREGVQKAVHEANAEGREIQFCSHLLTQGAAEAVGILSDSSHPWGVVTADETLGVLLSEALIGEGRRVPQEVAIVNFNSTEASAKARIPLTSVYQPLCEIGFKAVTLLASLLGGESVPPGIQRVSVRLDIRESSGGL